MCTSSQLLRRAKSPRKFSRRQPSETRENRLMVAAERVLVTAAAVLMLVSCGGGNPEPSGEPASDAKRLIVKLSDLPPGYAIVPGETIPTTLQSVLADPVLADLKAEIERERIGGFQTSVWDSEHRRIQCSVAVYRSSTAAHRILEHSRSRLRAVFAVRVLGRPAAVGSLAKDVGAFRFGVGRLKELAVGWRHRNVLAICVALERKPPALAMLTDIVSAQQTRLGTTLG